MRKMPFLNEERSPVAKNIPLDMEYASNGV